MHLVKHKFSIADTVIVNHGMIDPDFGQDISGWVGAVEGCCFVEGTGYIYKVRWSKETLNESRVLRVSCEERGIDFETMQLFESELSLHSSVRGQRFIDQCLHLPRRKRACSYGDFVIG